jgi:Family of unknown function (DUF5317)
VTVIYGLGLGILLGLTRGGRLGNLAELKFTWPLVALAGLVAQLLLFSAPVAAVVGQAGPILYVASSLVVLAVVLRNRQLPGLKLVALGAISNLVAILANGGYMPADPAALALAGLDPTTGYSNSIVTNNAAFPGLTDIFAIPSWLPFANVFSVGDVLIGAGIVVAVAAGMEERPLPEQPGGERPEPASPQRAPEAAAEGPGPVPSGNSPD